MAKENLNKLLEDLIKSQAKTDEQFKKTDERMAKLQAKTDEQFKKTDKRMAKLQAKTDEQFKKTDQRIDKQWGRFFNRQGDDWESFFSESLKEKPCLQNIKFDEVTTNLKCHTNLQREIDIFMKNGEYVALIEVKVRPSQSDVKKLLREMANLGVEFPAFSKCKVIGAIAGKIITRSVKEYALRKGLSVLKPDIKHKEIIELKA